MSGAPTSHQQIAPHAQEPRGYDRLYWTLNGPLETNIFVLQDPANPEGPLEAYYRQTPTGTSWHPISQESVEETPVSSLTIEVCPLHDWVEVWLTNHDEHAEVGNPDCEWRRIPEDESTRHDQPVDEDDLQLGDWKLVKCCGVERPKNLEPFEIRASENSYITIHDFLTAVHPWLMAHRQDALKCLGETSGNTPLPAETKLFVDSGLPDFLSIEIEEDWIRNKKLKHGRGQENLPPNDIILQLGPNPPMPMPFIPYPSGV